MADDGQRRDAVEDLYAEYGALVHRTCRAILFDHHDAEDATQEVFAKLLARGCPSTVRDPRRWLLEVTRNHCIDRLRAASRRPASPVNPEHHGVAGDDAEERSVARANLRWLLSLLTPRQRDVMVRQAVLDEPLDTVAATLGMSYGAAAQLLHRARHVLMQAARGANAGVALLGGGLAGAGRGLRTLCLRVSVTGRVRAAGRVPLDPSMASPWPRCSSCCWAAHPRRSATTRAARRRRPGCGRPMHPSRCASPR